jgi:hypothetical protein
VRTDALLKPVGLAHLELAVRAQFALKPPRPKPVVSTER